MFSSSCSWFRLSADWLDELELPLPYGSRDLLTVNQANKLGGHLRKGEHASLVTFWSIGQERTTTSADGVQRKSKPILLRYYNVFNVEQTDGIADKLGLGKS